jgi:hypothetical protein
MRLLGLKPNIQFLTRQRSPPTVDEKPDLIAPLDKDAVIYDELAGKNELTNELVMIVREADYKCDSISALLPFVFSPGYKLHCNQQRYSYEIADKGGHWIVTVQ